MGGLSEQLTELPNLAQSHLLKCRNGPHRSTNYASGPFLHFTSGLVQIVKVEHSLTFSLQKIKKEKLRTSIMQSVSQKSS